MSILQGTAKPNTLSNEDRAVKLCHIFSDESYHPFLKELLNFFDISAFKYWLSHFEKEEQKQLKKLRKVFLNLFKSIFVTNDLSEITFNQYVNKITSLIEIKESLITDNLLEALALLANKNKQTFIEIEAKRQERDIKLTAIEKLISKSSLLKKLVMKIVFPAPHWIPKIDPSYSPDQLLSTDLEKFSQKIDDIGENIPSGEFWKDFKTIKSELKDISQNNSTALIYEWLEAKYKDLYFKKGISITRQKYHIKYTSSENISLVGMTLQSTDLPPDQYQRAEHYFYLMGNGQSMENYYQQIKIDIAIAKKNGLNLVAHIINPRGVAKSQNTAETADDLINDYRVIIQDTINKLNKINPPTDIPSGSNFTVVGHSLGAGLGAEVVKQLHEQIDTNGKKLYQVKFENGSSFATTADAIDNSDSTKKSSIFVKIVASVLRAFGWQIEALKAYKAIPAQYTWFKGLKGKKNTTESENIKQKQARHNLDGVIGYKGAFFRNAKLSKNMLEEKIAYCEIMLLLARAVTDPRKLTDHYFHEEIKISRAKYFCQKGDIVAGFEKIKGVFGVLENAFLTTPSENKEKSLGKLYGRNMHILQLYILLNKNKGKLKKDLNYWKLLAVDRESNKKDMTLNLDRATSVILKDLYASIKELHHRRFKAPLFYVEQLENNLQQTAQANPGNDSNHISNDKTEKAEEVVFPKSLPSVKPHNISRDHQKSHYNDMTANEYTIAMTLQRNKIIKQLAQEQAQQPQAEETTQVKIPIASSSKELTSPTTLMQYYDYEPQEEKERKPQITCSLS